MKLNYYIKKPDGQKPSLIYIQIRLCNKKIVISTKQFIDTKIWDRDNQRVDANFASEENGLIYLNKNLDRIEREYDKLLLEMMFRGKLAPYNFRSDLLYTDLKRIIQFQSPFDRELMAKYSKMQRDSLHPSYLIQRLKREGWPTEMAKKHPVLLELKKLGILTKRTIKKIQNDNRNHITNGMRAGSK